MRDLVAGALLDDSEEAFCVLDPEGRFVYANEHAERLLRRSHEELSGRRVWEEFPGAVGESVRLAHQRAFEEGMRVACETYYAPLDAWFEVRAYPKRGLLVVHFRDIARRKMVQSALRESEARHRVVVETVSEAILIMDAESTIRFASPAVERVFGYTADELLGRSMDLLIPERLREAHRTGVAHYSRTEEKRIPWTGVEFPGLHKNGREIPLEISFAEHEQGGQRMFTGIVRDISERKRAEAALRESEERFQLVAGATGDVIWDHDFRTGRLWWSEHFTHLFGYPPEEVGDTFASWEERVHPEDRARVLGRIEEALRTRQHVLSAEYRFRHSTGAYLHVLDRMRFLYDEAGRPRRAVGVLVDVTEHKAAEERQRFLVQAGELMTATLDYRQRLRGLARVCCGPLCDFCLVDVVEEDGTVCRLEAAHADPDRESLARELLRFPPASAREEGAHRALRTGKPVRAERVSEATLRRIAQTDEHLEIIRALDPRSYLALPLQIRGRTVGAITLVISRPGRRFAEEDVQLARELARQAALDIDNARMHRDVDRARQRAEESSRVKGQFLAMMSHELRTPLTAIIGFSDLIDSEASGPVTAKQKEQVARIKASAWHLVTLVDEVLAFSRMEAGAERLRRQPTDVAHLAQEVVSLFLPEARAKDLELRCRVPEEPVVIRTDPGKLRQIMTNLLGNAIKFTEAGEIELEMRAREGRVELRVRDTGPGIAPEDQERMFEPFVQAEDTTTRHHGGTGLGLAISRRFARMLGGDVEVESVPGSGSTFTLQLPPSSRV